MHFKSIIQNCSLKPYSLGGFEPGSSVPEADAMSTAPRHIYEKYNWTQKK
jgi:hypothetical protein